MAKLHEGLAVHKDRSAVAKKVMDEARGTFKQATHFAGFVKHTEYLAEEDARFNALEEKKVDETVQKKLDYVNGHMRSLLDLDFQIERANTGAAADLILDGDVMAAGVPVGFLLTLENKFKEYRAVVEMIPTQAPGVQWEPDTAQATDGTILKTKLPQVTWLTKKKPVYTIVAPATEQHPAQVKESHDDVRVAKVTTDHYTSTITPAQKSDMLARCDAVVRAAKRARQRANDVELPEDRVAIKLLDYVVHGKPPA